MPNASERKAPCGGSCGHEPERRNFCVVVRADTNQNGGKIYLEEDVFLACWPCSVKPKITIVAAIHYFLFP